MKTIEMLKDLPVISRSRCILFTISIIAMMAASLFEIFRISLIIPAINILSQGGFSGDPKIAYLDTILKTLPLEPGAGTFILLAFLALITIWAGNGCIMFSVICISRLSTDITHSLRTKIFSRYLSFGKVFFDKNQVGSLVTVMLDNTKDIGVVLVAMRPLLLSLVMSLTFLVFLFTISWRFTLICLPVVLIAYFPLQWYMKKLGSSMQKQVAASIGIGAYATDVLSNSVLVRAYTNEDGENDRFTEKSDHLRRYTRHNFNRHGFVPRFTDVVVSTGFMLLVFAFVLFSAKTGSFSIGFVILYFYVLMRFAAMLKSASELKGYILKLKALLEKIRWVFNDVNKRSLTDGTVDLGAFKDKVEFKNVDFRYVKEKPVLKDICLTVKKGCMAAVVGPTGSGKTTIASLLCRFYDPDSGVIEIDGVDIRRFSLKSLRGRIAYVMQETAMLSDTIRNNMLYGVKRSVGQEELDDAAKKACIYEFIKNLPEGYETLVGDKGVRLSGGEKQRVAIARALLKDSDILILDEATSALDSATEDLVHKAIENLTSGKTVLAIAHRISTIKNADLVMVVEGGRIVEQGSIEELLNRKEKFYHYWNFQRA